ncbi:DUF423 domain-containing protein [Salegentibacter sp. HM20]
MARNFLISGTIFGMIAVILGAFGAHAFETLLDTAALKSYETGVRYQMYHALLLLLLGILKITGINPGKWSFWLFVSGIVLFSGSIYLLATNDLTGFDFRKIALVTPLGGSLLIAGWLVLLTKFIKLKSK